MILVDSSVWIDYFRGAATPTSEKLDALLRTEALYLGDLILAEVLQGFTADRDFERALQQLDELDCIAIAGQNGAAAAARNYRILRAQGITVRKTIDCLIATRCILDGYALLYSDRDFDPFVKHLGLECANL